MSTTPALAPLDNAVEAPIEVAEMSRAEFDQLSQFITSQIGIQMPYHKVQMLQGRLLRRMRALGLNSVAAYCQYLFQHPQGREEQLHFFDAVTTNKTDFFREPKHFEFLLSQVVPYFTPRLSPARYQIWCAGCSTGEEPYTLAMLLADYASSPAALTQRFQFSILATDINMRVLEHARRGIYTPAQIEPIPASLRSRFLRRSKAGDRFRLHPLLREAISFHRLNLMDPSYPIADTFDAIFCRNVMIYFDRPTQEQVLRKLLQFLRPSGYLFIGHSESANGFSLLARSVGASILQKAG